MNRTYFYVCVRTDISVADQICQVAHACADAGGAFELADCWLVLLQVKSQEQLLKLAEKLVEAGVGHVLNLEPDDDLGYTAICTRGVTAEERRLFRKYRAWCYTVA